MNLKSTLIFILAMLMFAGSFKEIMAYCGQKCDNGCPCSGWEPCLDGACDCQTCGGPPPCSPDCTNKECGTNGCSGSCGSCDGEPYTRGCAAGACKFEKAVLVASVNTPCLDETTESQKFMISGRSEFCGDISIKLPWETNSRVIESSKTLLNYSFQEIIDIPNNYRNPTTQIFIDVIGNRNAKKSAKDEKNYVDECKDTLLLELTYLNMYYCPVLSDVVIGPDGRFDYYEDQANYVFDAVTYSRWDDCVTDVEVVSCSPQPTDCVGSTQKPNSNGMVVFGAKWVSQGHDLGAYQFDGVDDYIEFNGNSLGSLFSQVVWIYPTHTDDGFHGILGNQGGDVKMRSPSLWVFEKKKIHGGFGDGTNWNAFVTGNILTENAWNHVAATFDGTKYKIYVNGIEKFTTNALSGKIPVNTPVKHIGKVDNFFKGKIDEVKIFDYALTPKQVCTQAGKNFNNGVCG